MSSLVNSQNGLRCVAKFAVQRAMTRIRRIGPAKKSGEGLAPVVPKYAQKLGMSHHGSADLITPYSKAKRVPAPWKKAQST